MSSSSPSSSSSSSAARVPSGLALNTQVRTSTGTRSLATLTVGDMVYNENDELVRVTGMGDPYDTEVRKISYRQFDSSREAEFLCTPNHLFSFIATGVEPDIVESIKGVRWFTLCKRPPLDEASLLMDSVVELGEQDAVKFAACRLELKRRSCSHGSCNGMRYITRKFTTVEQARQAYQVIRSEYFSVLDPYMVMQGEILNITVADFERNICASQLVKKRYLKAHRVPLGESLPRVEVDEESSSLPVDPYFVGLWLGDGCVKTTSIVASEPEIKTWLEGYVRRLQAAHPNLHTLHLHSVLAASAGDVMANGYIGNVDVYSHYISTHSGCRDNPVRNGLRQLGILESKAGGIPQAIMHGTVQERLKCLAGLMDSDGSKVRGHNAFAFKQATEGHRRLAEDVRTMAMSVGICCTEIKVSEQYTSLLGRTTTVFAFCLTAGGAQINPYLQLKRKCYEASRRHNNHDVKPIRIEDGGIKTVISVEVDGGCFQLANRLLVNC